MSLPQVVSRQEWEVARKALLEAEKEMTRAHNELKTRRRELPMVKIEEDYTFEGLDGTASLLDLFLGRRQLIIRHFMFDPSWDEGCPSCTAASDEVSDGLLAHLHARDTTFVTISRAPLRKIEAYRIRKGWRFPWCSSFGSDFNYDFHVTLDESVAPVEFNYRNKSEFEQVGLGWLSEGSSEQPGHSMFLRDGNNVVHTIPCLPGGRKRSAVRTTSSISPRSDGRRDGRNRKVVFPTPTVPDPISPHEPSRSTGGRRVILHACDQEQYRHRGKTV